MSDRTPKIRFKGFTDAWEQRKLDDIMTLGNGKDYKHLLPGTIPVYGTGGYMTSVNQHLCDKDSIGIGRKGTIDQPYILKAPFWTVDTLFFATPKDNIELDFLFGLFQNIDWKSRDESTGVPSLSKQIINNVEVYVSSDKGEQKRIGEFLSHLDTFITLHQRKLEKLKNVKKSCLEKMFPKNGSKYPEVRFKGFTDAWEQRKLSDIADRITRKNDNLESELPLTISAQFGLIDQNEFFDKRIASKDVRGYYLVKKGEFAYNKSTSADAPWGAVKRLDRYEMGVISTLYIVFALKDSSVSSDFITCYYDTDNWHKQVSERAAEGARNHGLLNISAEDFLDTSLFLPTNLEEQKSIGLFLQKFDNLITLHQRKLDKLKNLKKAFLEKMFV